MRHVIAAARAVAQQHGTPGAMTRTRALIDALAAVGPDLAVVVAAARWTDRYGRAGAPQAFGALVARVEQLATSATVPTVTIPADEHERLLAVVAAARDWEGDLARPGEGCPDCGASGEPAAEKRLEGAVSALWSSDGRSPR